VREKSQQNQANAQKSIWIVARIATTVGGSLCARMKS
jgi:hypothetical protein